MGSLIHMKLNMIFTELHKLFNISVLFLICHSFIHQIKSQFFIHIFCSDIINSMNLKLSPLILPFFAHKLTICDSTIKYYFTSSIILEKLITFHNTKIVKNFLDKNQPNNANSMISLF